MSQTDFNSLFCAYLTQYCCKLYEQSTSARITYINTTLHWIKKKPHFLLCSFSLYDTMREAKELFSDITLEEYGELVLQANGKTGLKMHQGDGFIWFDYTDTPEEQEIYYLAVCCRSADAYWIINFATPASTKKRF